MRSGAIRRFGSYFIDNILLSLLQIFWVFFAWSQIQTLIDLAIQVENGLISMQEYWTLYWDALKDIYIMMGIPVLVGGLIYMIVLPYYWDGKTIGRHIVGVKLQTTDGSPLTFGKIFVREFFFKVLWWVITLGIGSIVDFIMVGVREDKLTIRDIVTKTEVVDIEGESVKEEYYNF